MELLPGMVDAPLAILGNRPTRIGTLLIKLHRQLLPILLAEAKTIYLEEHEVPNQYPMYTYDALQCFEPETVKVFVYKKE